MGSAIEKIGSVTLETQIAGNPFSLEYDIVHVDSMPEQLLIGDPILDFAEVKLTKEGPVFTPFIGEGYIRLMQSEAGDEITSLIARVPTEYRDRVKDLIFKCANVNLNNRKEVPIELDIKLKDTRSVYSLVR